MHPLCSPAHILKTACSIYALIDFAPVQIDAELYSIMNDAPCELVITLYNVFLRSI